jgi:DNA-binding transcriptional LysR family regulator
LKTVKNLQGLVSFVESAAGGSFTAAAARLDLTPAAVSKNVMKLEQQVGVRLFNRTTRRLTLTTEGREFAERARDALRGLDDAMAGVSRAGANVSGRVRISVGIGFGRRFVLPLAAALAEQHAQLEIEVSLDNRAVDLVAEGFDIGVRGGVIADSSLVARRIARLPVVLVAAPEYLKRWGVPGAPADLAAHRLLAVRHASGAVSAWRFRRPSGRGSFDHPPAARVLASDPEALVDLALAGHGICQTGLWHALPHLRAGRLKLVLATQHDPGEREIVLHYPHRQFLSARVRTVVDALLTNFAAAEDLQATPADAPAAWHATVKSVTTRSRKTTP